MVLYISYIVQIGPGGSVAGTRKGKVEDRPSAQEEGD